MYRKIFLIFSFFIILNLSGCFIKALHPFYHRDDLIFDDAFLGSWYDQDSDRWEIIQHKGSKGFMKGDTLYQSYLVKLTEGEFQDEFIVHMFNLNTDTYLDFYPLLENNNSPWHAEDRNSDLFNYHILPTHTLAGFYKKNDSLIYVKWFNEEWLKMLFEQRRIKISHEIIERDKNDKTYVLTANTDELRKFVLKYGNDPKAFKALWEAKPEDQDREDFTIILRRADVAQN